MDHTEETRARCFIYVCNTVREAQRGSSVHGSAGAEQLFAVKSEHKKDIRVVFELDSMS
jgi:hypothetical protein